MKRILFIYFIIVSSAYHPSIFAQSSTDQLDSLLASFTDDSFKQAQPLIDHLSDASQQVLYRRKFKEAQKKYFKEHEQEYADQIKNLAKTVTNQTSIDDLKNLIKQIDALHKKIKSPQILAQVMPIIQDVRKKLTEKSAREMMQQRRAYIQGILKLHKDPNVEQAKLTLTNARIMQQDILDAAKRKTTPTYTFDQLFAAYQKGLSLYLQAYKDAGLRVDPRDTSTAIMVALMTMYSYILADIKQRAQTILQAQRAKQDVSSQLDALTTQLDSYDANINSLTTQLFGSQAELARSAYTTKRTTMVLGLYVAALKNLTTASITQTVLNRAQTYYAKAVSYWNKDVTLVGFATANDIKKSVTSSLAKIYQAAATYILSSIDPTKNSSDQIIKAFGSAVDFDQKTVDLYIKDGDTASATAAQQIVTSIQKRVSDYKNAVSQQDQATALEAAGDADSVQKAAAMYATVAQLYQQVQFPSLAQTWLAKSQKLKADVSVMNGTKLLAQYVQFSSSVQGTPDVVQAAQMGVEPGANAQLITQARDAYKNAYDLYVAVGNALTTDPNATVYQQLLPALVHAYQLLDALVQALAFQGKADTQAQLRTEQGLSSAEQLYASARQFYRTMDALTSQDAMLINLVPLLASSAGSTYQAQESLHIARVYRVIGAGLASTNASLALLYYATVALQGVDMSVDIGQLQGKVDFLATAQQALQAVQARPASDWSVSSDTLIRPAQVAWQRVFALFQLAVQYHAQGAEQAYTQALASYASVIKQRKDSIDMPDLYTASAYYVGVQFFTLLNNTDYSTQLQTILNQFVQQATTALAGWQKECDRNVLLKKFDVAIPLAERIVQGYLYMYPNSTQFIIQHTDDVLAAAQVNVLTIYKTWADQLFDQKKYNDAFTYYAKVRTGYQALGKKDLADEKSLKQHYFLAQTLSVASYLAGQVVTSGEITLAPTIKVPAAYVIKEYLQPLPLGVSDQLKAADCVEFCFKVYRAQDAGFAWSTLYDATGQRIGSLPADQAHIADMIDQAWQEYAAQYLHPANYTVEIINQGGAQYLKETNKPVPPTTAAYQGAPTAMTYLYAALTLYRPGTNLVKVGDKAYVPGQDEAAAWDIEKTIAYAFLSEAMQYEKIIADVPAADTSFAAFQKISAAAEQLYDRFFSAQNFLQGKEHETDFKGTSPLANQVMTLNEVLAKYLKKVGDILEKCIQGSPTSNDYKTMLDGTIKWYALAQQSYQNYYQAKGSKDAVSAQLMLHNALLYSKAGKACMQAQEPQYFQATPFFSSALSYYQAVTKQFPSMKERAKRLSLEVMQKMYEAYFKAGADSMTKFRTAMTQKDLIGGLTFDQLIEKRAKASTAGSSVYLSQDEFNEYNQCEGYALDALIYFLLAQQKYNDLPAQERAITDQAKKDLATTAESAVKAYVVSAGLTYDDKLNDNKDFQALAIKGFDALSKTQPPTVRYLALSTWSFKLYYSFAQTYMRIYLPGLASDEQWAELKTRTESHLREETDAAAGM